MDLLWPQSPEGDPLADPQPARATSAVALAHPASDPRPWSGTQLPALPAVASGSIEAWRQQLEAAGFTAAERQRLIFERLRPRLEGLAR